MKHLIPAIVGAVALSASAFRSECVTGDATSAATEWTFMRPQDTTVIGFPHETPHPGHRGCRCVERVRVRADTDGASFHPGCAGRLLRRWQWHHRNPFVRSEER